MLITGTRTGIGKSLAEHFLGRGHTVIGCSRRASTIDHSDYRHFEVDLTESQQLKRMFRSVRQEFGHLDSVVNNAGTATMNHFMLTPEETTRKIFDINFFAMLGCSREAAKLLQRSDRASTSILNISTVAVPWALDGQLVYAASKSAVEQATRVMSKELASFGIRVNALGLPIVRTVLTRTLPDEARANALARQTIDRMCEFEDLVGPVEFLTSERSGFVTGETLYLGGVH
ncbi:SDR family NAD(P)-dependent oxidoreductase [Streptomyces sp. NPDC057695]|uniref:SDR family NAD(P)-dependent oxidoreductase n=1 Tax=unclassified Streptomyces TaxID=2593676 RepID=UPI00362D0662